MSSSQYECSDGNCSNASYEPASIDGIQFKALITGGKVELLINPKELTADWCTCTHLEPAESAAQVEESTDEYYTYALTTSDVTSDTSLYLEVTNNTLHTYIVEDEEFQVGASTPLRMTPFLGPTLNSIMDELVVDNEYTEQADAVLSGLGFVIKDTSSEDEKKKLLRDAVYLSHVCLVTSMLVDSTDLGDTLYTMSGYLFDANTVESRALSSDVDTYLDILKIRASTPVQPSARTLSTVAYNGYQISGAFYSSASDVPNNDFEIAVLTKKIDALASAFQNSSSSSELAEDIKNIKSSHSELEHLVANSIKQVESTNASLEERLSKLASKVDSTSTMSSNMKEFMSNLGAITGVRRRKSK